MPDNFGRAVEIVLNQEGVFSDDPRDRGGITKYGITKVALAEYSKRNVSEISDDEIRNLTVDKAKDIYLVVFWRGARCHELPWVFALPLFDVAVNKGPQTAIILWQSALRVRADGDFGRKTLETSHVAAQTKQSREDALSRFYAARIFADTKDSTFEAFGRGWIARQFKVSWRAMLE